MFSFLALLCLANDPTTCQASAPLEPFVTEEACENFAMENIPKIDLNKFTVEYRCIGWGKDA